MTGVLWRKLKIRFRRPRPLAEQLDRRAAPQVGIGLFGRQPVDIGQLQRRDGEFVLAIHPQHLPAGDQHLEARRRGEQIGNQRGSRHNLLEVIQRQQQMPPAQVIFEDIGRRSAGNFMDVQRPGNRSGNKCRVADRRQGDKIHAVGESRRLHQLLRRGDRQAGLSCAGRAGQGQQAHAWLPQQIAYGVYFAFASHETGERRRQVGGKRRSISLPGAARSREQRLIFPPAGFIHELACIAARKAYKGLDLF